ncbi:hypothetical protein BU17DRAFT_49565 [Hysterangium stoloniferum]|nr:hypothetical protein BU17DRAFT_49565 [Hysterangium stoloniferum]
MPLFSRLLPPIIAAYSIQGISALIFIPLRNETYYDFCGSLGFLSATLTSLYYPALRAMLWDRAPGSFPPISSFASRQLLVTAALGLWTVRLGIFLLKRSLEHGGDSRLKKVKNYPKKFAIYWFVQGTWTVLVGLPVYLVNVLPTTPRVSLGPLDYLSFALFATSLTAEILADHQKTAWRQRKNKKEHSENFISSGLWSLSRHPNYVAEVGVWAGIWAMSARALQFTPFPRLGPALAALSPIFTWFLLTRVSGVPPLERATDKRFRDDPDYKAYKQRVPVFWPQWPRHRGVS